MLSPRRLLTIDASAYPSAGAVGTDEYNNPVAQLGAPVACKVWCHQTSTLETTLDTDQAQESWTVYLMPGEGTTWDDLAGFDFGSVVEVPTLQLRLQANGQPRRWVHPPTGQLSYLEVETLTADDGWVS